MAYDSEAGDSEAGGRKVSAGGEHRATYHQNLSHDHSSKGPRAASLPGARASKEWEDAQTDVAMWSSLPIFLVTLVIIGGYSASAGLVFMILAFTALALFFAANG